MSRRRKHLLFALALSLSVAPACDEPVEADFGDDDDIEFRPGFGAGGLLLNTSAIGDHPLHEFDRTGLLHENVILEGVYVPKQMGKKTVWSRLQSVWVEQGQIKGKTQDGVLLEGAGLVGSRWHFYTYGGGAKERDLYLVQHSFNEKAKLHKYVFGYPNNAEYGQHFYTKKGVEIPGTPYLGVCGAGGSLEAVVYEDLHVDMKTGEGAKVGNVINLACLSGAVGKAATWGYKSYELGVQKFIGAVRMIRADYCGDGDSWTKPGTEIDLQDTWNIHKFYEPTNKTEALWNHKGALCLTVPRREEFKATDVLCGGKVLPDCADDTLGTVPWATLWTKVPPSP